MTKLILTVVTALSLIKSCIALEERGYGEKTSVYTRMGDKYNAHVRTYHSDVCTPCTKTKTVSTTKTEVVDPKSKFTTTITTTKTITADSPSTTTVASSAGFIPVRSSLPDPGAPEAEVGAQSKRSPAPAPGLSRRGYNPMKPGKYPQRVDVYHYKEKKQCVTNTKTVIQTKKACKTPVKSTVTSTATSKVTVYPSTTTVYAACQTDNMVSTYRGARINQIGFTDLRAPDENGGSGVSSVFTNVTDATACCVAAILMSPPSVVWAYNMEISENGDSGMTNTGNCAILLNTQCRATPRENGPNFDATVFSDAREAPGKSPTTVGNSYCGQFDRGCYTDANGVRTCDPVGNPMSDPPVDEPTELDP